jgi:8-oxo-dGTP diphosphatase
MFLRETSRGPRRRDCGPAATRESPETVVLGSRHNFPLSVRLTRSYSEFVAEDQWQAPGALLTADLVILTLRGSSLQVLLVERGVEPYLGAMALPGGFLRSRDEDILAAARRELSEEAGLDADGLHLEQLGVYGAPGRDPRGRVVSVAYLAIAPRLPEPVAGTDAVGACWTPVDLVLSSCVELAFDHRQIVADGVERARAKLEHSALATAFCGQVFTISELQQVYEAVWGVRLDPRNFYRKVQSTRGFIVADGPMRKGETGRPARLFRAGPVKVLYPPMVRSASPAREEETSR